MADGEKSLSAPITQYPYDCICLIEDVIPGVGSFRGSGVIIGPHTILTASHVLWDADTQKGAARVDIFPGYDSSGNEDPTTGQLIGTETWHYFKVDDRNDKLTRRASQYDFAIIDTSADLSSYGSFGVLTNFSGGQATLSGYPAVNQHLQYKISGNVTPNSTYNVLDFNNFSSSPGYSGGPVWVDRGSADDPLPYVVGVDSTTKYASKLTPAAWTIIQGWEQADGVATASQTTRAPAGSSADLFAAGRHQADAQTLISGSPLGAGHYEQTATFVDHHPLLQGGGDFFDHGPHQRLSADAAATRFF